MWKFLLCLVQVTLGKNWKSYAVQTIWTSVKPPLIFFVQSVSFCETLDSVSEYRPEFVLKVVFFLHSENTEEMNQETLFLNGGSQDPHPYFF